MSYIVLYLLLYIATLWALLREISFREDVKLGDFLMASILCLFLPLGLSYTGYGVFERKIGPDKVLIKKRES